MPQFVELLNGDLIRTGTIVAVRLGEEHASPEDITHIRPRVIVNFNAGGHPNCSIVEFDTAEQRDEYANELKAQLRS